MAQKYFPMHITSSSRRPVGFSLAGNTDRFGITARQEIYGPALGVPASYMVQANASTTLRCLPIVDTTAPFQSADIDVYLRYRQHFFGVSSEEYSMGLLIRGSATSSRTAIQGYGIFPNHSRANHRALKVERLHGTTTQQFRQVMLWPTFGSARNFAVRQPPPLARNLRVKIAGSIMVIWCWWDGEDAADYMNSTRNDTVITTAGVVGILFRAVQCPTFEFYAASVANGTDEPLQTLPSRQLDGVVYQPRDPVSGSTTVPAGGFPVRAYHRATGVMVGSAITATNGSYSVTGLGYGAEESTLVCIDNNQDNEEWGGAIKSPVTPTES